MRPGPDRKSSFGSASVGRSWQPSSKYVLLVGCCSCYGKGVSAELIGILGVGAALGGLVLTLGGLMISLQSRTDTRTDKRLDAFDKRLDAFVDELSGLRGELRALGERVARLEGLIEGSGLFRPLGPSEATGD